MSLGSIGSALVGTTILKIKADTSEARAELKKLSGAERDAQEQAIKAAQARSEHLEKVKLGFQQLNVYAQIAQTGIGYLTDAFKAYEAQAAKTGGAELDRAKHFRATLGEMHDAWNRTEVAIGRAVTASDAYIHNLAQIVGYVGKLTEATGKLLDTKLGKLAFFGAGGVDWGNSDITNGGDFEEWQKTYAKLSSAQRARVGAAQMDATASEAQRILDALVKSYRNKPDRGGGGGGYVVGGDVQDRGGYVDENGYYVSGGGLRTRDAGWYAREQNAIPVSVGNSAYGGLGDVGISTYRSISGTTSVGSQDLSSYADFAKKQYDELNAQITKERRETLVETIFGPIEQFDTYHRAFTALTDAVGSAYEAAVTGAMKWQDAVKQSLKASLLAAGKDASIRAITELAYGFASLAIGGPIGGASAAHHFASAALFTAGAAAAGVAAHSIGSGGGSAPGGANVTGGVGGGGGGGQTVINNYLGDFFSDNNPREQQRRVSRAIRQSQSNSANVKGVTR